MKNKVVLASCTALALFSSVVAYSFWHSNRALESQIADYAQQAEQLLTHIEENTRQRLGLENRIDELNRALLQTETRATTLDNQLVAARQQVDPDFAQIEQRLRQQIRAEIEPPVAQQRTASATTLISELAALNSEERMAVVSVQAQYGDFIDSLVASPDRKERIVQALIDVTIGQGQAREELLSQGLEPRELRSQMIDIMGPGAVSEALAYELEDDELALFEEYTSNQQTLVSGTVGGGGVYMIRGGGPNGPRVRQNRGDIIINPGADTQAGQRIIIQQFQTEDQAPR